MKKIALNLLYIIPNKVGGTQTYAEGILKHLNSVNSNIEFHIFCTREYFTYLKDKNYGFVFHPIKINNRNRMLRFLYENLILPIYIKKLNISVIHSLGYTSPLYVPCKNIVTIHDLNWHYQKESFSQLSRLIWKTLVTFSSKLSDLIITDSQASKNSIKNILNISDNKIKVVYPGVTTYKQSNKNINQIDNRIRKKYILTVSSLLPHKNIFRLLQAFKKTSIKNKNIQLVIVGLGGKDKNKINSFINKNFDKNKVIILGWVSNTELSTLYNKANLFVFPSLYEGFGFPVLESFKYNTPVISSDKFSLKEIIGNAAEIINPYSINNISKVMSNVLTNKKLRYDLINAGKKQARLFKWSLTVKKLVKIYND